MVQGRIRPQQDEGAAALKERSAGRAVKNVKPWLFLRLHLHTGWAAVGIAYDIS